MMLIVFDGTWYLVLDVVEGAKKVARFTSLYGALAAYPDARYVLGSRRPRPRRSVPRTPSTPVWGPSVDSVAGKAPRGTTGTKGRSRREAAMRRLDNRSMDSFSRAVK